MTLMILFSLVCLNAVFVAPTPEERLAAATVLPFSVGMAVVFGRARIW